MAVILGLESSCDESAAALLAADGRILAERVASQSAHAAHGGVVPEIAARAHLATLPDLVRQVLAEADLTPSDLTAVAATTGPGLVGGLIVGSCLGKGIAMATRARFIAVNHLEGHALTARIPQVSPEGCPFPYLLLLVSGGHCQILRVAGVGDYRKLGGTIDDAAGEAFDKVAKMLGLPWPGGRALERLAHAGDGDAIPLPRPMAGRPGCDFSFSGLKTAVRQIIDREPPGALGKNRAADIAASFEEAVAAIIADRVANALAMTDAPTLVVAGGVAANTRIRSRLAALADDRGIRLIAPPLRLCGDNAVMIAWAGLERLRAGLVGDELDAPARPRWPLDAA